MLSTVSRGNHHLRLVRLTILKCLDHRTIPARAFSVLVDLVTVPAEDIAEILLKPTVGCG
jgi:hypothetical protein